MSRAVHDSCAWLPRGQHGDVTAGIDTACGYPSLPFCIIFCAGLSPGLAAQAMAAMGRLRGGAMEGGWSC